MLPRSRFCLLLLCFELLRGSVSAYSVPEDLKTVEQQFRKASEVFLARIVSTKEMVCRDSRFPGDIPVVEGRYQLKEIFKGNPSAEAPVRDFVFGFGNCSLGLLAGLHYVFFVYDDHRFVLLPNGIAAIVNLDSANVQEYLAQLRTFKEDRR